MIVPVMAISNLVLTQQIYSEETNGAHAHYREPVPLSAQNLIPIWKILIIAGDMTLVSGDITLGEMTLGRIDRKPA